MSLSHLKLSKQTTNNKQQTGKQANKFIASKCRILYRQFDEIHANKRSNNTDAYNAEKMSKRSRKYREAFVEQKRRQRRPSGSEQSEIEIEGGKQ